jgi:2-methylcitrate dehydratase PrpD
MVGATMTSVERLAAFVAGLRFDDIPARVVEKARLQQASVIAAALAGRLEAGVRKVAAAVLGRGETGPARLLAASGRVPVHAALVANAAASCAFDWDEILLLGHPGHSAALVPLALAEARPGTTLAACLCAQVAADEVAARLGLACFFGPQNGQNLPFIHLAGGAAAGAAILGLDAARTAHAIAISLAQPPAALWPSFLGPIESKVLTAAHPAEIGLAAAEMAAAGLRGPLDILDHPRGFFHRFSFLPVRRALGGLGRTWLTDTLQAKTHAACWYFQAPLDAAREALARVGRPALRPDDVRRVRVGATMLAASVDALARGRSAADRRIEPNIMNFRLDLSIALFLLAGRLGPRELEAGALAAREPDLRAMAAKVEVQHDLALSRRTVAACDAALDLARLLGDAGAGAIIGALGRARREFAGMPGPGLREAAGLARAALGAVQALRQARGQAYDLGDRTEAVAALALPCPGTVEIDMAGGPRVEGAASVPAGAFSDLARARPLVREKLALAIEIAGASAADARLRAAAALDVPLDAPATRVLDIAAGAAAAQAGHPAARG